MMHWYGSGWSWWAASLMWIGMIAFWGLVIWAVSSLVTNGSRSNHGERPDEARHVLDARLAQGEIDPDEYRRRRDAMAASGEGRR